LKKFIAAGLLSLLLVSQVASVGPSTIQPIASELFSPVVIPSIVDAFPTYAPAPRPVPNVPKPTPKIKEKPQPTKTPVILNHTLYGVASWYCLPGVSVCTYTHPSGGYYAAIRRDLLELRGKRVLVCVQGTDRCVRVTLIDCNCGVNANLIDLYYDAFNAISDPSLGRIKVVLKW